MKILTKFEYKQAAQAFSESSTMAEMTLKLVNLGWNIDRAADTAHKFFN